MTSLEKNFTESAFRSKSIALLIFIILISFMMSWWNFGLPGLQVDEVNKAAFVPGMLNKSAARLHHYRLPDNVIDLLDRTPQYPIIGGAFYNSVISAYLGLPFYKIFGFSVASIRAFHAGIGFLCVLLGSFLVARFAGFLSAFIFASIIITNPDIVFSLRSQAAIFWPVIMFALASLYLLQGVQAAANEKRQKWLIFFSGLFLGFCVMSYFVGAFIVLPILVYAWFSLNKSKKQYLTLLCGLFCGYLPIIYSVLSVLLVNHHFLVNFGMPTFALKNRIATFSYENLTRALLLIQYGAGKLMLTKGVVGNFIDTFSTSRVAVFAATVTLGFWALVRRKQLMSQTVIFAISSAILTIYFLGAFFLKSLSFHHLIPLFFIITLQLSVLTSSSGFLKYLSILLCIILLAGNANALILAHKTLEKTGGNGYHNEQFSRIAEIINTNCHNCYPVFVSWGAHLQFLFLTQGRQKYSFLIDPDTNILKNLIYEHGKIVLVGLTTDLDKIKLNSIEEFNSFDLKREEGIPAFKMKMLQISKDR